MLLVQIYKHHPHVRGIMIILKKNWMRKQEYFMIYWVKNINNFIRVVILYVTTQPKVQIDGLKSSIQKWLTKLNIFKHVPTYILDLTPVDIRCGTISCDITFYRPFRKFRPRNSLNFLGFFHPILIEEILSTNSISWTSSSFHSPPSNTVSGWLWYHL